MGTPYSLGFQPKCLSLIFLSSSFMGISGSSNVSDSRLRVRPIEGDDDLVEATMDLLRAHIRLIMVGALTMEESNPVLLSVFSALRRFGLNNRICCLMSIGGRLESLLGRWEKAM